MDFAQILEHIVPQTLQDFHELWMQFKFKIPTFSNLKYYLNKRTLNQNFLLSLWRKHFMFLKNKRHQWLWVKKELKVSVRLSLVSGGIFPFGYLHMNFQRERGPSVSSYTTSSIHHPVHHVESLYNDLQAQILVLCWF